LREQPNLDPPLFDWFTRLWRAGRFMSGPDSPELSLGNLIDLLGDDFPAVVVGDDPITKMHDSLSMVPFHFEILVKLYEARELAGYVFRSLGVIDKENVAQAS
jgi:hypothetical protein